MRSKLRELLPLRHWRPAFSTGDDHRLCHARQGILRLKRGRRTTEGTDAGTDIVVDPVRLQKIHLLPDGTVERRVTRVEAGNIGPRLRGLEIQRADLIEIHVLRIIDARIRPALLEQRRIHQRTRVDHDLRLAEKPRALPCDKLRIARTRPDKMNHNCLVS